MKTKYMVFYVLLLAAVLVVAGCKVQNGEEKTSLAGQAYTIGTCRSTDGTGVNPKPYNTAGTTRLGTGAIQRDTCFLSADGQNKLKEFYCDASGNPVMEEVLCSSGLKGSVCDGGRCLVPSCADSDSMNYNVKGTTRGLDIRGDRLSTRFTDTCVDGTKVKEYFCNSNNRDVLFNEITCPVGQTCNGGKCVSTSPGLTACRSETVNLNTDNNNCGGCGIVCGVGYSCNSGLCLANPDTDGDGVVDSIDNCPSVPNPDQADADGDRFGDVCDTVCGNDEVETGEQCDDGNTANGDGCSSTCQTEVTPPTDSFCSGRTWGPGATNGNKICRGAQMTNAYARTGTCLDLTNEVNCCAISSVTSSTCAGSVVLNETVVTSCGSETSRRLVVNCALSPDARFNACAVLAGDPYWGGSWAQCVACGQKICRPIGAAGPDGVMASCSSGWTEIGTTPAC